MRRRRKVSLTEIVIPARRGGKSQAMRAHLAEAVGRPIIAATLNGRSAEVDVIEHATRPAIVRVRICTPITPKAVRDQLLAALADYPDDEKETLIKARLTPLDVFLGDDAAYALETYATEEENLQKMTIGAFGGERVQSSPSERGMSDTRLAALGRHARAKRTLSADELEGLGTWCQQMTAMKMAPSFAEAGRVVAWLGAPYEGEPTSARRRADDIAIAAWFRFLRAVGEKLARAYAARQ